MKSQVFGLTVFLITKLTSCQLIRDIEIYDVIVNGIHDYFNNTCIILLHSIQDPVEAQGVDENTRLMEIQALFSKLHIRTAILDMHTFNQKVGASYYHIKRPLFILLNDDKKLRHQLMDVAKWITMAYPTWLIFFGDDTSIEDYFKDMYIPFDCNFLVAQKDSSGTAETITEVYQIEPDTPIIRGTFATYNEQDGVKTTTITFYDRRSDLRGKHFRVTSIEDPPVSLIVRDTKGDMIDLEGFFGDLIRLLADYMNCTISYIESTSWGLIDPVNNTWTGSLGMLIRDEADLVASELMMTDSRIEAIDFTTPVYTTKSRVYIKRPTTTSVKWKAFIAPFGYDVWNSLALLTAVTTFCISVARSVAGLVHPEKNNMDESEKRFYDILFAVYGSFCSQGMYPSILDTVRLIHVAIHLTGVIIIASYSAALISFLALKTIILPFTTMEGMVRDRTYSFGAVAESADYMFFKNTTDKVLSVLFDQLMIDDLPKNYFLGLEKVCKEERFAFMAMDNVVEQLQPFLECNLEPLDSMMQTTLAMALKQNSPYRGIINNNIYKIRDSGILQRMLSSVIVKKTSASKDGYTPVEIFDIFPLMLFLLVGFAGGFLLLLFERVIYTNRKVEAKIFDAVKKSVLRLVRGKKIVVNK